MANLPWLFFSKLKQGEIFDAVDTVIRQSP